MNYDFSPSTFTFPLNTVIHHQRKHQSQHRHHNDNAPDNTVQYPDTSQVELCTDLIDKKGYAKPPSQSTQCDGRYPVTARTPAHPHLQKRKRAKKTYKKENNQWIGKCDGKCRYEVMEIGTLIGGYRPDGLYRIAAERINAKCQQKNASEKLQVKDVLVDIIKNETHPVAVSKAYAISLSEALSPLRNHTTVLYSKYAEYTILLQDQWRGHNDADNEPLPQYVKYGLYLNHGCKYRTFYETNE